MLDGSDLSEVTPATDAEVIAIIPDAGKMQIVHEDGTIRTLDRVSRQVTATQKQGIRLAQPAASPGLAARACSWPATKAPSSASAPTTH